MNLKENYADSVPCRTLDVQYFQPVFFRSLLCGILRNRCAISPEYANNPYSFDYVPGEPPEYPKTEYNYREKCLRDGFARDNEGIERRGGRG